MIDELPTRLVHHLPAAGAACALALGTALALQFAGPAQAQAAAPLPDGVDYLEVGGELIVGWDDETDESGTFPSSNPAVNYNASTNTLTLSNCTLSGDQGIDYSGSKDFTVKLVGANKIALGSEGLFAIKTNAEPKLTVTGPGSLTADTGLIAQESDDDARACGDIVVDGATLVSSGLGIWSEYSDLTIKNATVKVNNTTFAANKLNPYLGTTTGRTSGGDRYKGKLTIQNSTVELKQGKKIATELSTLLAWNTLSLSGEHAYIGESAAQYATSLQKVATVDWDKRTWFDGSYLLLTPEKKNLPELVVATPAPALSKTTFAYTGKTLKPKVTVKVKGKKLASSHYTVSWPAGNKTVGSHAGKITLKNGYFGTKEFTYTINPKAPKAKKPTAKKKAIVAKWKKVSGATGYEVQYSLQKSFKGAKTVKVDSGKAVSTTISGLKTKKKYYVRVCAVQVVEKADSENGATVRSVDSFKSAWSKVKTAKTK